ncbi:MAG: Uma2 family endonuclease [Thermoguttaceae bacterium]|jgi:Uma2 family endonuclease|nr:Uma2 family endonuclease [Thermoguttaceae bacterium]
MGTGVNSSADPAAFSAPLEHVPELYAGDRLTRVEFERRYSAMPQVKKAELIEGVVYMPSPVSREHAGPHFCVVLWLGTYVLHTPGVEGYDNATIRLDLDNEPQPDAFLRVRPELGGQSRDDEKYVAGPPELVAEVTASSASYDLHDKLHAFRRNGVREYVVWRVEDRAIDWFVLREGRYDRIPLDAGGVYRSEVFPGLWLDPAALVAGDLARVMAVLQQGLASPQHAEFVKRLEQQPGHSS